jgi:alkyl sulfatase BDS1-like metallo-beta-lactamase superfamily hydrolase
MKTKSKQFLIILSTLLIVTLVGPVIAQSFTTPSHVEFDQSFQGTKLEGIYSKMNITTQEEAEKYPFTWWRDTTKQNSLWAHSVEQAPNQVIQAYSSPNVKVLVWAGTTGPNVIAIVGPDGNTIVGAGGSRTTAKIALNAFNKTVPNFQVNLRGIIFNEANKEMIWGAAEWVGTNVNRTAPVQIYGHASLIEVMATKQAISPAAIQHELYTYAPDLPYGPDGNLGVGTEFSYNPYQLDNGLVQPNRLIVSDTTVNLGGVAIEFIPTAPEDAGLAIYLPTDKVLILGELFGKYFPPYGSIDGVTNMPPTRWINVLNTMINIKANVLVPLHALPIFTAADVTVALTDTKNALTSVHTQVVQKINAGMSEADIVASVKIPEPLASQPYVQEYASSVECAVRAMYHYYVGWFNWEVEDLDTLTKMEQAQFIIDLAGGPQKALAIAREYESDHTIAGVKKAIIVSGALRLIAPSREADLVYIQALEKMGYSQESGELRNFYLRLAMKAEATMGS